MLLRDVEGVHFIMRIKIKSKNNTHYTTIYEGALYTECEA